MHIFISKLTIIGSDNGLPPGQHQASVWTNDRMLLSGPLVTKFSEISIRIQTFSFKKMHLKMLSAKWHLFCLGLNVLAFLVLRPEYFQRTRSVKWLLMPWFCPSSCLQQPCDWHLGINVSFYFFMRNILMSSYFYCWVKSDYVYFDVSSKWYST